MGKELVDFYTQPHTGMLFIYPIEYRFVNIYSFPVSCVLAFNGELQGRICYYGYEQRNAIVAGDIVWFERLNKELNTLLDSNLQANKNLIAQSDEAMLQFKKIKCAVLPKGMEFIYRDFIKRSTSLNKKLLAETLNHRLKIFSVLDDGEIFTEADLIDLDIVGSKEKSTNLDLVNNTSSKIKNANLHIELKDSEKVKNTFLDKNIIEHVNQETLIDIREQLIQLSTLSPLANILNIDLNATPSNKRDAQLNLSYIFSEQNITRAIYLITENLMSLEKDKDFIGVDKLIELTRNTLLVGTDLKFTEKAERYIKRACTHQTLESYIRKLLDIQQLNKIITFDNTLKNLTFNKMIGMGKQNKDFETREPWNGLSELVPNETEIIHNIIYLESVSKLGDIVTKLPGGYKNSRLSTKSFKYYTYRKQYKVFKSYFKHLQTTKKEKSSEKLCKVLLTSLLKFRDTFIHDMDYGLLGTEKIPNDLIISLKSILTESPEKQSVKDMLKVNFGDKLKNGGNISVSLEGIADTKNSYTFYITLQSEVGTKLYFDFGYDQITAEKAHTLMAVYNDIVCVSKNYTELYNSIMLQFETLEKELLLLRTEHTDKLKFLDIIGNLYLQDKLKNKDFETREPWNGLSELVPNETEIIHDILYLDSLSKLGDIVTKLLGGYKSSRLSTKSFKYYTYRKQYKVFKSYFKHLQTTKEKSSEKLCKVLLTSLLKFRDTFIHDMDYGLLGTEKIPNDLIISLKSILTESPEKQSVKDMLKVNFGDKLKNGGNISVSLEGIADTKNSYTFYITLQSEVGTKLYFDFGYDQITAEKAHTLMAVYNDIVYNQITAEKAHTHMAVYNDIEYDQITAEKSHTHMAVYNDIVYNQITAEKAHTHMAVYNSIMLQFETLEKELLLLRTEHADKLKFSDITGNLYLQDKLKNAIISIQQLADKLKLTNIDLASDELEKIKELLLVGKFVLNELYHRWYFLPADGPYDEMILPQDYPYADKPVNGINEHPFPQGADKATREIPVDIDILTNVIDFCFNLWEANIFLYGGFTPQQAIKHFVNLVYEWLAKYVPTKIDKIPEYYPEDYEIYDNPDTEREDYWRLYRWIRWYAEAIVMNVPKEDEIKLKGNTYIKKLLEDLIKYFEDHHGIFGPPGTKVIDKIKGLRHKWLDKYNII